MDNHINQRLMNELYRRPMTEKQVAQLLGEAGVAALKKFDQSGIVYKSENSDGISYGLNDEVAAAYYENVIEGFF